MVKAMDVDQFLQELEAMKREWHRLSSQLSRLEERIEWFELALFEIESTHVPPLCALMTVERNNPSALHSFMTDLKYMAERRNTDFRVAYSDLYENKETGNG